jgi:diguanylate cyclase (GGDEF)-like protein/PAS domain S-box-containing protein
MRRARAASPVLRRFWSRSISTAEAAGWIVLLSAGCWSVSYAVGGAAVGPPLWFLLPIMVAAARFGLVGGLTTAAVSGLMAGPLLPDAVATGQPQATSDWVVRAGFFLAVAVVMAAIRSRSARRAAVFAGELRQADRRFRALVEGLPLVTYIDSLTDSAANLYSSPQITSLLGYTPEQRQADPDIFPRILHPDDRARVLALVAHCNATGDPFVSEYRLRAADGTYVWVHDESVIVHDEDGTPLYAQGCFLDIRARKQAEEELHRIAFHDPLTGLPNRRRFEEHLARRLADPSGSPLGVLFIDLDDFKLVNDSFGHAVGDELLRQVGERLSAAVRRGDTVARQGGDEFLILIAAGGSDGDGGAAAAAGVARDVRNALAQPFRLAERAVYVSASIGISLSPTDAADANALLKHADVAMYASKRSGRNAYSFYAQDGHDALAELSMTARLRSALERDEFELHYQPIVQLDSGVVIGAEALIRWREPDGALLPPGRFLPLAERVGLMADISDWVVDRAVAQAGTWQRAGLDLYVSANLPPALWSPGTMQRLIDRIDGERLESGRLMIELTETAATTEQQPEASVLREQLERRGVRLAIDDFGTGYSSISRLNQLLVTAVKIDRSFIRDVPGSAEATRLVRATVQLSRNLGLQPIAEGIETPAQRSFLLAQRCAVGQGFLFGGAVPPDELVRVYIASRAQIA